METRVRNWARLVGYALLLASMVLSYRGFEFNFDKAEGIWKLVFIAIGVLLTCAVTIIQMIFNTDYANLNTTLKVFGLVSYVYSIYTNYQGLKPFMSIDGNDYTVWVVAVFLDAVPEPMITWAMGESLKGDILGNVKKWLGLEVTPVQQRREEPKPQQHPEKPRHEEEDLPQFLQGRGSVNAVDMLRGQQKPQSRQEPREKGQHPTFHQMKRE